MGIGALVTWLITALGGFYMLGTWIRNGGTKKPSTSKFPPGLIFGHFALAAAGLVVWIIYLFADMDALAWVAFVLLLPVAVLGFTMLARWWSARGQVTEQAAAEQRFPIPVIAGHGVFAVTTVVLVLLSALGIGQA
ncbi:hypothetical protein [Flindersiella endophytica]